MKWVAFKREVRSLALKQMKMYQIMKTFGASLIAQSVKNPPAMQQTQVQSLGWEDPLEKEMASHSSILAWRIPWIEEPGGLQSTGLQEWDTTERLNHHRHQGWQQTPSPGGCGGHCVRVQGLV